MNRLRWWPVMVVVILLSFSGIIYLTLWLVVAFLCKGIGVR